MKRFTLALLALLLCLGAALTSCTTVDPDDWNVPILNGTTEENLFPSSPSQGQPVTGPASLVGKWYSTKGGYVFQFFTDGKMKSYSLTPGFYEYDAISEGEYTYVDRLLTVTLSDGSTLSSKLTSTDNGFKMLADSQELTFVPVDELPPEHVSLTHPDYEEMVKDHPLAATSLTGNTIAAAELYQKALESIQTTYWSELPSSSLIKVTEGTVAEGDRLNINYQGLLNGVAFEGGTATGTDVTARDGTGMIDGFCSGLIGHEVGETFDVPLTFPEDYHNQELAGKDVVFRMTINHIYDLTLTDGMAINKGYSTVEEWQDEEFDRLLKEELWSFFSDKLDADVPAEAYAYQAASLYEYYRATCFHYFDNNFETFLTYVGMTDAELLEYCRTSNRALGSSYFWAAQIVAAYELTPDEELLEQVTEDYIESYTSMGYTEEAVREFMENAGRLEFRAELIKTLAENYLIANNTFSKT